MIWSGNLSPFPSPFVWEAWLQRRNFKQPNTQGFKGNYFFFLTNKQQGGKKKSMVKSRRIFSWRRSGELSWTRRAAGRDVGSGWFLASGMSLGPLPPRCHCHTHARRRWGWTPSLHAAHTSLLKSRWNRGEKAGGNSKLIIWWSLFRKRGGILTCPKRCWEMVSESGMG